MRRLVVIWGILGLLSLTYAQLDPRAAPFLDYGSALEHEAKPKTLAYTLCTTTYTDSKAESEVCTRSAVDYVQRRMAVRTTSSGGADYKSDMVYQSGRVYITDFSTGKLELLPPAQAKPIEKTLKKTFDAAVQGNFIPDHFERTHYDGPVSYGDIISGEQVSATVKLPSTNSENSGPKSTTVRLIFGKDKELLGMVTPVAEGGMLTVINHPQAKMTLAQFLGTTSYQLEHGKPVLVSKDRIVKFQFDKPLDEKLFTVPKN